MPRTIETDWKKPPAPHAWAIEANGSLYLVHVPLRPDGSIEDGDAKTQAEITLEDLNKTLEAAGASIQDVVLVQICLASLEFKSAVDEVYIRYFSKSRPVRACIAVSELPTPGTVIEMVVTTAVPG